MPTRIRTRRDTAANWASINPVLGLGEEGWERDTGVVKIGDGSTPYNSLPVDVGGPMQTLTITGTSHTLVVANASKMLFFTNAAPVAVALANLYVNAEAILVALGAGGLSVTYVGMTFKNNWTPPLTIARGQQLLVKQTNTSEWSVQGGSAP